MQAHTGPYRPTLDHPGPHRAIQTHTGPPMPTEGHTEPYRAMQANRGSQGAIKTNTDHSCQQQHSRHSPNSPFTGLIKITLSSSPSDTVHMYLPFKKPPTLGRKQYLSTFNSHYTYIYHSTSMEKISTNSPRKSR